MTADLATQVLDALCKIAPEIDPATVDRGAVLTDQLDIDSMDVQRFLAALATRFRVDIPESAVAQLTTIDQIVAYLDARR